MGWTQEMQSHCFAFQASSLRFGLQCWWFCGLGLIGQPKLLRQLGSAMWAFFLLSFGAEMSTSLVLLYVSLAAEEPSRVGCTLMTVIVVCSHVASIILTYDADMPYSLPFLKSAHLLSCQESD